MGAILSFTGHRPEKLGGHSPFATALLRDFAYDLLSFKAQYISEAVVGMALGWDMAVAYACWRLDIPFTAAIPFKGQEGKWPVASAREYHNLLLHAHNIVYVCEPGYAAWKMQVRNEWMVNRSAGTIALWDGSPGGTHNCIDYALKKGKPVLNAWSLWDQYKQDRIVARALMNRPLPRVQ